ncbi:pyridoxamine 5'-phosphate oxidase family protein [Sphaerisporangium aureirubrum]|uniref:Pyridoxamine 5'-phosphate oxidase family protein n=1 Tax=Sphaerisporangium aureirubrum TaxID=1544736 RepID=A0ABW1NAH0_9ACTN
MHETDSELEELQALLDVSLAGSTAHLRSIVKPGERTIPARQLTEVLTGMCTLALSTVTARGEPRIGGVDGHFLHGKWIFGTSTTAAKAVHLRTRPAVSAAHMRGESLGVFTHGAARILNPPDAPADPGWPETLAYLTTHYGESPTNWGDVAYYRLDPHWMIVYTFDPKDITPA